MTNLWRNRAGITVYLYTSKTQIPKIDINIATPSFRPCVRYANNLQEKDMATEIHPRPDRQINRNDNNVLLWTVLIVLAVLVFGYIVYASYYSTNNYNMPGNTNTY